jgi:multidrug efflux system outer membrane protein
MRERGPRACESARSLSRLRFAARAARLLLPLSLAPPLAGCLFDEPAPDLAVPIPSAYRADPSPPQPMPPIDWPRLFKSAELTRLAVAAEYQNLDVAAAVARIAEADAQAQVAAAGLYPVATGSANAEREHSAGTLHSKTGPFITSTQNLYSFGVNASYEIDFWGQFRAAANAGLFLAKASRFDRDVVALSSVGSVVNDYFQILAAQDRLALARDNVKIAERVLQAIRVRLSVGTATALDIAQQESVVAQQRAAVPPLEETIQQNRNLIAVLLGRTPESMSVRGGSLNRIALPRVAPGVPSQLLLRRPDVAEAEARLAAKNQDVIAARAALLPNISLTGSGGFESIALRTLLRPEAGFATLAAGIATPIFDGGNLAGQLALQRATRSELLQDYRRAVLSALSDVENALIAIKQTSEHERLQAQVVVASRRAQDITEARLKEGTIDVTTLLQTETTLFQAEDQLAQFRLDRLQAYINLFQALGGGFDLDADAAPAAEVQKSTIIKAFIPEPINALSKEP